MHRLIRIALCSLSGMLILNGMAAAQGPERDDLAALSDEFDDPASLANWKRVFREEKWNADQLERIDINRSTKGQMTLVPYTSSWYQDWRGVLVHKRVKGDFAVTTRVRATSRAGDGPPRQMFSLAGIMIRTPRDVTPQTWRPGGENYLFLSHGTANQPGTYQFEVKTTRDSRSELEITASNGPEEEIRAVRLGEHFLLLRKNRQGDWTVHRRYHRPDMPEELQVGMTVYTDWQNVERTQPAQHNRTVIRQGNPDLIASFDYFRFARPVIPTEWRGRAYSNPQQLSDAELLSVLGSRLDVPPAR